MNRTIVALLIPFVGLTIAQTSAQANLVDGDNLLIDFNTATDVNGFVVVRDDTPATSTLGIGQNATKGTGAIASGGVEGINVGTVNGGNDLAALYAPGGTTSSAGLISLAAGNQLTLSLKFQVDDNTKAATPRLGIASAADVNAATANGVTLDINGGKDIIGGTTSGNWADGIAVNVATGGDKTFNISDVVGGGGRTFTTDASGPYVLTDGSWYQFVLDITKSYTSDTFEVSAVMNLLNTDGTAFSSQIGSVSTTIVNAGLYADDVFAGFTIVHDGGPATMSNEYDDLQISIVPEPNSLALLGLGGLALIVRRRK